MAPPLQRGPPAFESRILDTVGIQNELCSQFHRGALTGDARLALTRKNTNADRSMNQPIIPERLGRF
jgi:hypothetical protein